MRNLKTIAFFFVLQASLRSGLRAAAPEILTTPQTPRNGTVQTSPPLASHTNIPVVSKAAPKGANTTISALAPAAPVTASRAPLTTTIRSGPSTATSAQATTTSATATSTSTMELITNSNIGGGGGGGASTVGPSTTDSYVTPHVRTLLEERLSHITCDVPPLPNGSRLWMGNETHELLLPIVIPSDCPAPAATAATAVLGNKTSTTTPAHLPSDDCQPPSLSWEGSIEIQSGDVLLVRIDDSFLVQGNRQKGAESNLIPPDTEPVLAVYQVNRHGHENCDKTEGDLLDITPLKVDNRKVVTLYDKDLAEGMNLLIVTSESWINQCVRLKVLVKSDNCGESEDCSFKGICYSNKTMEGYECQCCPGYIGTHCEEHDACFPNPCLNNGICVDFTQGHNGAQYQCLCPYGYTGQRCEKETDPCTSMPCFNGATCRGNVTQFKCECPKGFAGAQCQHSLNECESSPCVNGICVDREEGYKCYCSQGYTGVNCDIEYNECISMPCGNGATCTDLVGEYTCQCTRGYTGKNCHIKVDMCNPDPCPQSHYCVDKGNNYSCECPQGAAGPDCNDYVHAACSTNPCMNGGTCWSSMNSYYCACKPGFTGENCEDEFVVETIANGEGTSRQSDMDLQMPISIHFDHLSNLYIAGGTLLCALTIVGLIVAACHCKLNKVYKRFVVRGYPLLPCGGRRVPEAASTTNSEWFSRKDKAPMATPSRSLPSLDTTDMYYTVDFSDSQSSPLIQ